MTILERQKYTRREIGYCSFLFFYFCLRVFLNFKNGLLSLLLENQAIKITRQTGGHVRDAQGADLQAGRREGRAWGTWG